MKLNQTASALLLSVSALSISACATAPGEDRVTTEETSGRLQAVDARVADLSRTLTDVQATPRPSNVRVQEGIYLGNDGFRTRNGDPLPARFEGPNGISLNLPRPVEIARFAEIIAKATGIQVEFLDILSAPLPDIKSDENGEGSSASTSDSSGESSGSGSDNGASASGENAPLMAAIHPVERPLSINHTGSLSSLLTFVASQLDCDWEYRGGRIVFVGPQTRTYTVWSLPSSLSSETEIAGTAAFGAGSSGSTKSQFESDYWTSFEEGIGSIVPQIGARFSVNRTTGSMVVTAPKAVHDRVADFVERENARLSRQVSVKVDVISFTADDGDNRAVNLNAVFDSVSAGLGFSMKMAETAITGAPSLAASVIAGPGDQLSGLSGSTGMLQALSTYGRASLVSSTSMIAANNTPTPISVSRNKAYLSGSKSTEEEGAITTEITTDVVNSGLNMVVTPRILSSGEVVVQYSMRISEILDIEKFTSPDGSSTVQLPEIESRDLMQTVNMASGDSIVIASYDSEANSRGSSGPFNPAYWAVGGEAGFSTSQTRIIVMMTPIVLEGSNKPRVGR
jgi:type IVB pilus formation R64 PilN family outer membrane protein